MTIMIYRTTTDREKLMLHPGLAFCVESKLVRVITDFDDTKLVKRIHELLEVFGHDMSERVSHAFIEILKSDDLVVIRDMVPVMTFTVNGGGDCRTYEQCQWGAIEVVTNDLGFAKKLTEELKVLLKTVNGSDDTYPTHEKIKTVISVIQAIHAYRIDDVKFKTSQRYRDELEF